VKIGRQILKKIGSDGIRYNSKVVRVVRNIFVAGLGVHQSKILGVGTGDQLPPNFCRLKVSKNGVFAEIGAFW